MSPMHLTFEIEWIEEEPKTLKSGMLIRYRDDGYEAIGHPVFTELVGDVNEMDGTCDCCKRKGKIIAYSTSLVGLVNSVKGMK